MRIRLAVEADAGAIGVLVRRVVRQDVLPDQSAAAGAHLLAGMTARSERARIRAGNRYHVAEIGGRIVGVVATRDERRVFRLFVARRFRRRGIAKALLMRAIRDCRLRARTRRFTLFASAYAVPAYERMGFVATGRLSAHGPGRVVAKPMAYFARGPRTAKRRGGA